MNAASRNHIEFIALLMENSADINIQSNDGMEIISSE